jgi:hypothetical protein
LLAGKIAGTLQSTGKIFMAKNMRGCRWILVLSPSQLGLPSESIHEFREKISIPVLYIKIVDEIDESSVAFNSLADVRGTLLVPFYANLTVQYCTYCNAYTVPVSIFFISSIQTLPVFLECIRWQAGRERREFFPEPVSKDGVSTLFLLKPLIFYKPVSKFLQWFTYREWTYQILFLR